MKNSCRTHLWRSSLWFGKKLTFVYGLQCYGTFILRFKSNITFVFIYQQYYKLHFYGLESNVTFLFNSLKSDMTFVLLYRQKYAFFVMVWKVIRHSFYGIGGNTTLLFMVEEVICLLFYALESNMTFVFNV